MTVYPGHTTSLTSKSMLLIKNDLKCECMDLYVCELLSLEKSGQMKSSARSQK